MNKTVEYEVRYDLVAEISYLGEEEPNEHYFRIHRHWADLTFDDEDDEAKAVVFPDGKIEVEGYASIRIEEVKAIEEMMQEIIAKKVA